MAFPFLLDAHAFVIHYRTICFRHCLFSQHLTPVLNTRSLRASSPGELLEPERACSQATQYMTLLSTSRKTWCVQTERAVRETVVNFQFQNVLFICTYWFISFCFSDLWTKKTRRSVSGKQHHNIYNSSPLRAHIDFPLLFYLSTRGTTTCCNLK